MSEQNKQTPNAVVNAKNGTVGAAIVLIAGVLGIYLKVVDQAEKTSQSIADAAVLADNTERRLSDLEASADIGSDVDKEFQSAKIQLNSLTKTVAEIQNKLSVVIEQLEGEIKTLNDFRLGDFKQSEDSLRLELIQLRKLAEDSQGDLIRLTKDVADNSEFKVVQEKRATIRIEQQKNREGRLIEVEDYIAAERERDSARADDFEERAQRLQFKVRELEDELKLIKSRE